MDILSRDDICEIINNCYDAVDVSRFGPMCQYPDICNISDKQYNQLAYSVFTITLTGILRNINTNKGDKNET